MKRDLAALHGEIFDIVVIGGGIHGLAAAWDAALRGWRVALVERGDFGNASSSGSFRIIHGGLRYLQYLDFSRMRTSIRERRWMLFAAPHIVHPLKFLLPCYGHGLRGSKVMSMALRINDAVSFDRNNSMDPQKHLPRGKTLSRDETLKANGLLARDDLTGSGVFYDAQMTNSERLTLSFALSAAAEGACLASYVEAVGFLGDENRVRGIKARDRLHGNTFDIQARMVLNMSGPWADITSQMLFGEQPARSVKLSKGFQIFTRKITDGCAFAFEGSQVDPASVVSRGKRMYFVTPWNDHSFIGTTDELYEGDPDGFRITEEDVCKFLDEINASLPEANLNRQDVLHWCGGLRPVSENGNDPGAASSGHKYTIADHAQRDGVDGLISVVGVKYTTARFMAERVIDLAERKLGENRRSCATARTRLAHGGIARYDDFMRDIRSASPFDEETTRRLVQHYGTDVQGVLQEVRDEPRNAFLDGSNRVLRTEVKRAVQQEMAVTLEDVVLRRTDMGLLGNPGSKPIAHAARLMGELLGWSTQHTLREIDHMHSRFAGVASSITTNPDRVKSMAGTTAAAATKT